MVRCHALDAAARKALRMTAAPDPKALCEKLRATTGPVDFPDVRDLRNPDGPAAAALIERQQAEIARLTEQARLDAEAMLFAIDAVAHLHPHKARFKLEARLQARRAAEGEGGK